MIDELKIYESKKMLYVFDFTETKNGAVKKYFIIYIVKVLRVLHKTSMCQVLKVIQDARNDEYSTYHMKHKIPVQLENEYLYEIFNVKYKE